MEIEPQIKGGISFHADSRFAGMFNNTQHLDHFLSERRFGDLGKPLGREIIRSKTFVHRAIHLHLQPQKGIGHIGHGRDAVLERHARTQINQAGFAFKNTDLHEP